jgi:hypothetical protein
MADNFVANPGSGGSTFAADELAGPVLYPRVKVTWGADGVANDANATTPLPVQISGYASGGLSIFRSLDIDETEEDVSTNPCTVYGVWVTNTATSTRFVKFYNATAASTTVGSTTPVITIAIPGNASDDVSGVFNIGGQGIAFGTACCVAATTGAADADTGAPGASEVIINVFYK